MCRESSFESHFLERTALPKYNARWTYFHLRSYEKKVGSLNENLEIVSEGPRLGRINLSNTNRATVIVITIKYNLSKRKERIFGEANRKFLWQRGSSKGRGSLIGSCNQSFPDVYNIVMYLTALLHKQMKTTGGEQTSQVDQWWSPTPTHTSI